MCVTTASSTRRRRYPAVLTGISLRSQGIDRRAGRGTQRVPLEQFGTVAGCMVIDATSPELFRFACCAQPLIFEGALESLKRLKDDVNEVRAEPNAASA